MREYDRPMIGGLLLIGGGLLFLLANLGLIGPLAGLLWAGVFALGGGAFLAAYARNQAHWWALIPGCTLLGLGGLVALGELFPSFAAAWGGALFLGSISLGFWLIYLAHREHWWAIIPGGTLLSVALIAGVANRVPGEQSGALLFYGMALTFGLVYLSLPARPRQAWALLPAAVLLALGLMIQASFTAMIGVIWPALLIGFGLYLAYRALRAPRVPAVPAAHAPAAQPAAPDDMQLLEGLVNRAISAEPAPSEASQPAHASTPVEVLSTAGPKEDV